MNPYRPDPWNNEMDDKYVGWAHGFAGPAARIFRSNAYAQGFNEGKKKRIECVFVCAKCGYGPSARAQKGTTMSEPSTGAQKAACEFCRFHLPTDCPEARRDLAEIIERHTHAAELEAALINLLNAPGVPLVRRRVSDLLYCIATEGE